MEVILQVDVPSLGKAGEVIKVRDGFGRNYLLPEEKAILANPKNLKMLEHQKRVIAAKQEKVKKEVSDFAKKLSKLSLSIAREAGVVEENEEQGTTEEKLFGSVTTKDIAEALLAEGFVIDRRHIRLQEPIKKLGDFEIPIWLHSEVEARVKVSVVKK